MIVGILKKFYLFKTDSFLRLCDDGSGKGAALVAAIASRLAK